MKKQKTIGNKGFSLVELIIVIAIMAILVGVMAPQLLKYIERTRVSSDTQFADTVRTAVTTAILDPANMSDSNYQTSVSALSSPTDITALGTPLKKSVAETLGIEEDDLKPEWVQAQLKSADAEIIKVELVGSNNVVATVYKDASTPTEIVVGNTKTTTTPAGNGGNNEGENNG